MLNPTVLSFLLIPRVRVRIPPVPSGNYSVVRLDRNVCSNVSTTRSTPTRPFSGSPGSTRSSAARPSAHPPRLAWADWSHSATGCPSIAQTRRFPGFKRQFHLGTEQSRLRSEWVEVRLSACVFRDKAVGRAYTERGLGTLAGRVSRPAAALLGRFGDSASRSTGSARRAGGEGPRRPGNQNCSGSQDHEQRTLDLPGGEKDFSKSEKG